MFFLSNQLCPSVPGKWAVGWLPCTSIYSLPKKTPFGGYVATPTPVLLFSIWNVHFLFRLSWTLLNAAQFRTGSNESNNEVIFTNPCDCFEVSFTANSEHCIWKPVQARVKWLFGFCAKTVLNVIMESKSFFIKSKRLQAHKCIC